MTQVEASQEPKTSGPRDIYLDVPHYSQLDSESGITSDEARKICALVCMRTILEFKMPEYGPDKFSVPRLQALAMDVGGKTSEGWKHSAQVETMKGFGFTAWRRNWVAPTQDVDWLVHNENYEPAQVAAISAQLEQENALESMPAKVRASVVQSLERGNPVIASVGPGFSDNKANHQVVIHGYNSADWQENLLITDPIAVDAAHQTELVPLGRFMDFFQYRAIFIN